MRKKYYVVLDVFKQEQNVIFLWKFQGFQIIFILKATIYNFFFFLMERNNLKYISDHTYNSI